MADLDKALESLNQKVAQKGKKESTSHVRLEKESAALIPKTKKGSVAAPNALFRSALFPALNTNQERKFFRKEVKLFSVSGLDVIFSGEQFDQYDLDVYLAILDLAKDASIGDFIEFTGYSLLKTLNRGDKGENYQWLKESVKRLQSSTIVIRDHKAFYQGGLIDDFLKTEDENYYKVRLNKNYAVLFSKGMWSSINREQRKACGRNQTAKSLHAYYSTHTSPAPHNIETLANIAGLENKNKYMIPKTIMKAHDVLCSDEVDFLKSYEVSDKKIKVNIKIKKNTE